MGEYDDLAEGPIDRTPFVSSRVEIDRLRADLNASKAMHEDARLLACELHAEVDRLREVVNEADVMLGPWGGSAAGTIGALHNLVAEIERLRGVISEADRHLRNTIYAMRPTEPLPRTVVRAVELTQRDLMAALADTGEQS